ncbi:MAG TPA: hypothetical protein VFW92_02945, partial [Candidatus Limnocylindrales bacterium]|nr:hypothetical protein [Candidatus Limnocylindrales bacterium]
GRAPLPQGPDAQANRRGEAALGPRIPHDSLGSPTAGAFDCFARRPTRDDADDLAEADGCHRVEDVLEDGSVEQRRDELAAAEPGARARRQDDRADPSRLDHVA